MDRLGCTSHLLSPSRLYDIYEHQVQGHMPAALPNKGAAHQMDGMDYRGVGVDPLLGGAATEESSGDGYFGD